MKRCQHLLRRAKGGQQGWSPSGSGPSKNSASMYLSGAEGRMLAYRPLPNKDTVEYEEDFGNNLMIQREYFNPKFKNEATFDESPLGYSNVEIQSGKQRLAMMMNNERQSDATSSKKENMVRFETSFDPAAPVGEIESHRYLFDTTRMAYCSRFQSSFPELFSLMEACAVIAGCTTEEAREAYFKQFLQLDQESLELLAEEQRQLADTVGQGKKHQVLSDDTALSSVGTSLVENETADIFSALGIEDDTDTAAESSNESIDIDAEFAEFGPIIRTYEAFCEGTTPLPSQDLSKVGSVGYTAERFRWRKLMERLVAEDFHTLSELDMADAAVLNEQLHSIKFFEARLGETVKEAMQLHQRGDNAGIHRDQPVGMSASHPERR